MFTARQVSGRPALSFSSGSSIPSWTASFRSGSAMIGYPTLHEPKASTSYNDISIFSLLKKKHSSAYASVLALIHSRWSFTLSQDKAMTLTPRFSNWGKNFWTCDSSVVQTGVKSAGWLKSMAQDPPSQSWKSTRPVVVSQEKSGTTSPRRTALAWVLIWVPL